MVATAARLIWVSLRPMIRLVLTVLSGFTITKFDLFPAVAARGTGQILLNITLPLLFWSRIVASISSSNAKAIAPLLLVAIIYEALGGLLALMVKRCFWVPHRFRWGIVAAGIWANWGDIPNAIMTSITMNAPFNGNSDANLAVAYISIITFVFSLTLFPLGGHQLIAWDFHGPDREDSEVKQDAAIPKALSILRKRTGRSRTTADVEKAEVTCDDKEAERKAEDDTTPPAGNTKPTSKHVVFSDTSHHGISEDPLQHVTSPTQTITSTALESHIPPLHNYSSNKAADEAAPTPSRSHRWFAKSRTFLINFLKEWHRPRNMATLLGLPIALIPQLRALFVESSKIHIHDAPDGQPPLAFILDTATFIGTSSVPLGLINLGSALARMRIPTNNLKELPLGAIGSLAIAKMIAMPILGLLITQGLTNVGVIDKNDKVLRLVSILISATPTATTQVYLTQVYSGTGSAEHLSPFLLPQYAIMLFSTTALTVFGLRLIS